MKALKIIIFCLFCINAVAQLPAKWHGKWSGPLQINPAIKGYTNTTMSLEINQVDSVACTFIITYSTPGKPEDKRIYEIKSVDSKQYHFIVDEKNSIKIDEYLVADKLISKFEVEKSWLLCTYELQGNTIIYEVTSGNSEKYTESGNTQQGEETIPLVKSFGIYNWQRAVLKKL